MFWRIVYPTSIIPSPLPGAMFKDFWNHWHDGLLLCQMLRGCRPWRWTYRGNGNNYRPSRTSNSYRHSWTSSTLKSCLESHSFLQVITPLHDTSSNQNHFLLCVQVCVCVCMSVSVCVRERGREREETDVDRLGRGGGGE